MKYSSTYKLILGEEIIVRKLLKLYFKYSAIDFSSKTVDLDKNFTVFKPASILERR